MLLFAASLEVKGHKCHPKGVCAQPRDSQVAECRASSEVPRLQGGDEVGVHLPAHGGTEGKMTASHRQQR